MWPPIHPSRPALTRSSAQPQERRLSFDNLVPYWLRKILYDFVVAASSLVVTRCPYPYTPVHRRGRLRYHTPIRTIPAPAGTNYGVSRKGDYRYSHGEHVGRRSPRDCTRLSHERTKRDKSQKDPREQEKARVGGPSGCHLIVGGGFHGKRIPRRHSIVHPATLAADLIRRGETAIIVL